jgi:hypothetical protein
LKVPKFNGKDFATFKFAFLKCAKLLQMDEDTAQTQLICACEGPARSMLMTLPEPTTMVSMLHTLELRYGVNMSYAAVDNKLVDIRRKPGESLHDLYDRVTSLARRADYSAQERKYKERHAFFQALRTDSDLQHYVGRHDTADPPSIDVTLSLAMQYEMSYGRKDKGDSSSAKQVTTSPCDDTDASSEAVNRLQFTSLKAAKDPFIRQLGMQQNEMVELMKKQYQLFQTHLGGGVTAPRKTHSSKPSSTSSNGSKSAPSTSRSSPAGKPASTWKNKKPGGKPFFRPKAKVNQVEDEHPEEGECEQDCDEDEHGDEDPFDAEAPEEQE